VNILYNELLNPYIGSELVHTPQLIMRVNGRRGYAMNLSPGLRICVHPNITIYVATPDAANFALLIGKAADATVRSVKWEGDEWSYGTMMTDKEF
jgi:hypothetical protein